MSSRFGNMTAQRSTSVKGTAVRAVAAAERVAVARARSQAARRVMAVPPSIPLGRFRRTQSRSISAPERKAVDTSMAGALNFDTNSAVGLCMPLLNIIPTGSASNQRIGKRVTMRALQIRGRITAASATIASNIAAMLVYIKTPNQAASLPAVTEILVSQSSSSLSNRDNASKFRVLRRWNWQITGNITTPATGNEIKDFDEYVRLPNLPALWTNASTAGSIGEFVEGALILLLLGDAANGATTTPTFTGTARLYFSDA